MALGHQTRGPTSNTSAGTRRERTTNVLFAGALPA
jgi:hypothetical protein